MCWKWKKCLQNSCCYERLRPRGLLEYQRTGRLSHLPPAFKAAVKRKCRISCFMEFTRDQINLSYWRKRPNLSKYTDTMNDWEMQFKKKSSRDPTCAECFQSESENHTVYFPSCQSSPLSKREEGRHSKAIGRHSRTVKDAEAVDKLQEEGHLSSHKYYHPTLCVCTQV